MSANDEMRAYLNYLVRHQQECTAETCADCETAQHVFEFTRNLIFSIVTYPEVVIPAGGRAVAAVSAGGAGRKASRRAA